MTILKKVFLYVESLIALLSLKLALSTSNSVCFFLSYQPDEPESLSQMGSNLQTKSKE